MIGQFRSRGIFGGWRGPPLDPDIQSFLTLILVGIFIVVVIKILYDWYKETRRDGH